MPDSGNDNLILYSYWRSTAAYRTRIALNYKGLAHRTETVDLLAPAESTDAISYKAVNPQGFVPTLVARGETIIQSTAMLEYLEELYPEPPLLPDLIEDRAKVRGICQLIACDIHPINNKRVLDYLRSQLLIEEAGRMEWYSHWIREGFSALESLLNQRRGELCCGDHVTLADVYLVPQVYNARRFNCDISEFRNIADISEKLLRHPAFLAAAPERQLDSTQ